MRLSEVVWLSYPATNGSSSYRVDPGSERIPVQIGFQG